MSLTAIAPSPSTIFPTSTISHSLVPIPTQGADPNSLTAQCSSIYGILRAMRITPEWSSIVQCCSSIRSVPDASAAPAPVTLEQLWDQDPLAQPGKVAVGCVMDQLNHVYASSISINYYPGCHSGGSFPNMAGVPRLKMLSIQGCDFANSVIPWPQLSRDLPALERLQLSHMNLSGSIDRSVADWRRLTHLDASRNYLSGAMPVSIVELQNLQSLNLSNNIAIYGPLPGGVSLLRQLRVMDLEMTAISGTIPPMTQNLLMCKMPYLTCRAPDNALPMTCNPSSIRECAGSHVVNDDAGSQAPTSPVDRPWARGLLIGFAVLITIFAALALTMFVVRRRNLKRRNLSRGVLSARRVIAGGADGDESNADAAGGPRPPRRLTRFKGYFLKMSYLHPSTHSFAFPFGLF
ncbi:hypothetical protein BC829DRAFT_79850 [Chytridium lagenaria]|nr:hypothetical protein BC829DRAFT_79850 [Chytridium lagenaria]